MGLIRIDYRDRKLIYEQLIDNIKQLILVGELKKGDFLPSVRSLSKELGINPNTTQKAYTELERQEIIASMPGRGSVIVREAREMADMGCASLRPEMMQIAARAGAFGMNEQEFLTLAADCYRRNYKESKGKEIGTDD